MKVKEFLAQFENIDPELELYYESPDDPNFIFKPFDDQVFSKIGYVSDSDDLNSTG